MHIKTLASTLLLAITQRSTATLTLESPFAIRITGLQQFGSTLNATTTPYYLSNARDFFGDLTLQPTSNKTSALQFDLQPDRTLKSTTGMTIAVTPFTYDGQTTGQIKYVTYTGTESTYVKALNKVVNSYGNFSSWLACESQYGVSLEYVDRTYNVTAENEGAVFPCYKVVFHARG